MTFREDESRIRKKNAPENMSIIRHIVLNLLRKADEKISIRRRKKKAGWSDEYLENVLTSVASFLTNNWNFIF